MNCKLCHWHNPLRRDYSHLVVDLFREYDNIMTVFEWVSIWMCMCLCCSVLLANLLSFFNSYLTQTHTPICFYRTFNPLKYICNIWFYIWFFGSLFWIWMYTVLATTTYIVHAIEKCMLKHQHWNERFRIHIHKYIEWNVEVLFRSKDQKYASQMEYKSFYA